VLGLLPYPLSYSLRLFRKPGRATEVQSNRTGFVQRKSVRPSMQTKRRSHGAICYPVCFASTSFWLSSSSPVYSFDSTSDSLIQVTMIYHILYNICLLRIED